jgi:hypothetical protein
MNRARGRPVSGFSLFFTFAFPVIFMVIFGLIWSGDNNFQAGVGLASEEDSHTSQAISQPSKAFPRSQ